MQEYLVNLFSQRKGDLMEMDYADKNQTEQFGFIKIPRFLFTEKEFEKLSIRAKILYSLLIDRVSLSRANDWGDEGGRVYIIFTIRAIQNVMNCSEKTAIKYLAEIERYGLVEKVFQKIGQPHLLYVKIPSHLYNLPLQDSNNDSSAPVKSKAVELNKLQSNYTNNNNTDFNNTYPILSGDEERKGYEDYLNDQLCIPYLKQDFPYDGEMIDGIVEIILDVLCSKRKTIRIAGDDKSVNVVKGRFMKLNMEHVSYVMSCLKENTTKVRSIKQYLLAALYNAPTTISGYYQAEVSHDMATGKI